MAVRRVFLLSPANCGGERAQLLFSPRADFDLARRLRARGGAPLGEVMSFVSGLYFRGKLTYAARFGVPLIITPHAGLRPPEEPVTLARLRASARAVASVLKPDDGVTLLGSIASDKYVSALLDVFGARLTFPRVFVGRGDMSRGGLLLRSVRYDVELEYVPVMGAVRHGPRPPRLAPLR